MSFFIQMNEISHCVNNWHNWCIKDEGDDRHMAKPVPILREIREDDDFDQVQKLLTEKRKNFPNVRKLLFPQSDTRIGYIAEVGPKCVGFLFLELRGRDGMMNYAIDHSETDHFELLKHMVETCTAVILDRGGEHLAYFVNTEFGQLRNREIFALEQLGFRTYDEYMRISTRLSMQEWDVTDRIETENIKVESLDMDAVNRMLIEDGNFPNSLIFKHQFRKAEPSNVFLTLRNEQQDMMALAYYKVKRVNPSSDDLSATAFNLHFRPAYSLSKNEKKKFLQGVLLSMKQLDIRKVHSLMSLMHADVFTLMVREGFDEISSSFFALSKTIGSGNETV